MQVFIINLDFECRRRENIIKLCDRIKVNYRIIDAVYGKRINSNEIQSIYNKDMTISRLGRELTLCEIGCILSHRKIYEIIKEECIDRAVIFEDDIKFDSSIIEVFDSIDNMPITWEVIMLCYYRISFFRKVYTVIYNEKIKISSKFKAVRFANQMHSGAAYIVNFSSALKLLSLIDKGVYQPIDHYIGDDQHVNMYGIYPRPICIDPELGLSSAISPERNLKREKSKKDIIDCKIKFFLKKKWLFLFFFLKKMNLIKLNIFFYIESIIYRILHFTELLKKKRYKYNNIILIISPEHWDDHTVSKQHYAIILAKRGNYVFFLNPPVGDLKEVVIRKTSIDNLYLISSKKTLTGLRFFPSFIRQYFEKKWLHEVEKKIGEKIDIVWLFENSRFFDMRFAEDRVKIYHQVDLNQNFNLQIAASTADICFCTTNFIRDNIFKFNKKTYKINHGVTPVEERKLLSLEDSEKFKNDRANAVYVGNLEMEYLDNELLTQLVCKFKNVHFHFVGGYTKECSLWRSAGDLPNITWWGKVDYHLIPDLIKKSDVLLVTYKEKHSKDQANPHKIMEYLSSGKVIVATYTDEYKDKRYLLEMTDSSSEYINIFERVVNNLPEYNSQERQLMRKALAESNTYDKQIDKIFSLLKRHNLLPDN